MPDNTLASIQARIQQIQTTTLPSLQQQIATATAQREAAEATLKQAGWDGEQDLTEFLAGLETTREQLSTQADATLQEAENALASVPALQGG